MDWCKLVGTEPLLGFNLGTGSAEHAVAYVEYCNVDRGTKWSELRRQHGYEQPHNVRTWCMGNEMDGPWQMGHSTARDTARKARDNRPSDSASSIRPCGSSRAAPATPFCPLIWSGIAKFWKNVTIRSTASPCTTTTATTAALTGNDSARFLAMNLDMERQIHEVTGGLRLRAGTDKIAERLGYPSTNGISGTERATQKRATASEVSRRICWRKRTISRNALLVGGFLNSLLRQSDRVRVGLPRADRERDCAADDESNGLLRQSIYYSYAWALKYAQANCSISRSNPKRTTSRLTVCGQISRETMSSPISTLSQPLIRKTARCASSS